MRSGVVLLAAGAGRRFKNNTPKQFLPLKGAPLFAASLKIFSRLSSVKEIVIVCSKSYQRTIEATVKRIRPRASIQLVEGGAFRGASVRNGVRALEKKCDVVLVHDSARPLVSKEIVQRVERAAYKTGAALAAWPLPDTLKVANASQRVKKTIPRKGLWLAQTPQGFRYNVALKCLLNPSSTATDDVELAERKGLPVAIVEGSAANFKVTYPMDLKLCRLLY